MDKDADAYRTISEVAEALDIPPHVLRFWETRFPQIKPLKRGGGRRYYRRSDTELLRMIRRLLYDEGYTIRGVQRLLKSKAGGSAAPPEAVPAERDEEAQPVREEVSVQGGSRCSPGTIAELLAEVAACRALLATALRSSDSKPGSPVP